MNLTYDLHCHSTASDGTLKPAEVVRHARNQGVDVLALTDHDTLAGYPEAALAARECGLRLIPGVEISVTWGGGTIHILGLNVDHDNTLLQQGLVRLREFRAWRAEEIGRRLQQRANITQAAAGSCAFAHGGLVSRTHFARFLVQQGHAKTMQEAFNRYLKQGKPGHVPGEWADLEQALAWIHDAGGQAVLAHPARYPMSATKLRRLLAEFSEGGGVAMEVVSGSHARQEYLPLARLANRFGLLSSAGSDYHGPENPWIELGRLPALPAICTPLWQSWQLKPAVGQ